MATEVEMSAPAAAVEEESRHLLGAGTGSTGTRRSSRRVCCGWLSLRWFARDRDTTQPTTTRAVWKPMTDEEFRRHREERQRAFEKGLLAENPKLIEKCLHHYNSQHPHDQYEPAPGEVTRVMRRHSKGFLSHGNFVARRKSSSFLPAQRTLFFFELRFARDFSGVVTCVPLDEPVTEAYTVLGFPIWWGSRRDGRLDRICNTCCRRFSQTPACGHDNAERICELCHHRSPVIHPYPGEFAYGHRDYLYGCSTAATTEH